MRAFPVILLIAAALVRPSSAAAQDVDVTQLNLERLMRIDTEVVRDPSHYVDQLSTAPASTIVITGREIRSYGFRTLADVLNVIGGFYVTDDRNYSYIGTRGLAVPGDFNTRLLVLIDGHRINDNVYDSVLAGSEFPLDLDLVARLEVIRGPGTALFGVNALSAVINIVTRQGSSIGGFEMNVEGGSLEARRGRLTYGRRLSRGADLLLSATANAATGDRHVYFPEFDAPSTNGGVAVDSDRDRNRQLFAKLSFHDVVFRALYGARTKAVPTASFGSVFNDGREETYDARSFVEAQYGREVGLTGDVLVRGYYDAYRFYGHYPIFGLLGDDATSLLQTDGAGDALGAELAFTRRLTTRHRLAFASEWRANVRQNQALHAIDPALSFLDARHRSSMLAFNLEDQIRIRRGIMLSLAGRFDKETDFAARVTPRASLVIGPFAGTTLKALVAAASRMPSTFERFYEAPLSVANNPQLGPETIHSTELLAEHWFHPSIGMSASWYRSQLDHLIVPGLLDNGMTTLVNGSADVDGIEASAFYRPVAPTSVTVSYSYQHPRDAVSADRLHDSPRHLAKARASVQLPWTTWIASAHSEYAGQVVLHTGDELAGTWITGGSLSSAETWKPFEIGVSVSNLFDAAARYPVSDAHLEGSVPQYGRRFMVRLRWRP